jgi:Na+-transporting NADH:ubiquinone oxidoreductase subunit NqrB
MSIEDFKFYGSLICGGICCFVRGVLLLLIPGVPWWRAIASFPLGMLFFGLAFRCYIQSKDSSQQSEHEE